MDNSDKNNSAKDLITSVKTKNPSTILTFIKMLKDPKKSLKSKVFILIGMIATLVYIISPVDLIPEFTPIVGILDDLAVLGTSAFTIFMQIKKYRNKED